LSIIYTTQVDTGGASGKSVVFFLIKSPNHTTGAAINDDGAGSYNTLIGAAGSGEVHRWLKGRSPKPQIYSIIYTTQVDTGGLRQHNIRIT
jgi:hypothetical protein